jgi:hypothetical protein
VGSAAVIPRADRIYRFLPALSLGVCGDRGTLRHFDREYGSRLTRSDDPDVVVRFVDDVPLLPQAGAAVDGGHKTVRWRIALGNPGVRPLEAAIAISGWPRSFALSLVQGYFVEGLVSVAAPASGYVLVPGAALVSNDAAVLMLGPSGAGKSSVSARASAAGRMVIGDDQVLVDRTARCTRFPRRPRVYPDLAQTAPGAFQRLPGSTKLKLRARGAIARISRGYVRPSLAIDAREMALPSDRQSIDAAVSLKRLLILEPRAPVRVLQVVPESLPSALSTTRQVFNLQRKRLSSIASSDWRSRLEETAELEESILAEAFDRLLLERVRIPSGWSATRAVDALADLVGVGD